MHQVTVLKKEQTIKGDYMKSALITLLAVLTAHSSAWARAGEADACQVKTVNLAMRLALEDYQNFYVVKVSLLDRTRDNDNNQDNISLELENLNRETKKVEYQIAVANELNCEVQQIGGWFKAP